LIGGDDIDDDDDDEDCFLTSAKLLCQIDGLKCFVFRKYRNTQM